MKKIKHLLFSITVLCVLLLCSSWGFFVHKKVNKLAIYTLPKGMLDFYKQNAEYITQHAISADKRRYVDNMEAPRHFLDVENYEKQINLIPKKWTDAVAKYGIEKLYTDGMLPWQIQKTYYNLVKAFKERDSLRILKYSADLGHYIGDAHVPLHTTKNYDGQLTNQKGLHALWESRIPELFCKKDNIELVKAKYIENPLDEAWRIIKQSHTLLESTLSIEAKLNKGFSPNKKYQFNKKHIATKKYSVEYAKAYHDALHGMVERQMKATVLAIGSFWYSAWIDAGQPILKNMKARVKE